MSPKARLVEVGPDQGALFETHIIPSGVTDPEFAQNKIELEPAPEGFYAEKTEPIDEITVEEDETAAAALHKAVVKDNQHKAQVGKHSPLERSGSYEKGLKVGDYLPGFGPVKYRNIDDARRYAAGLDAERRK